MPCYLFTYHAFGSWMPDRQQGYVRHGKGILPQDMQAAALYWSNAKHEMVQFLAEHQISTISTLEEAVSHIHSRLHFIATDKTHVHALVSWAKDRTWQQNRTSLKRSVTFALKEKFGDRPWLSKGRRGSEFETGNTLNI
jgi:23S rRNA G2445 N2-methylase RlmL